MKGHYAVKVFTVSVDGETDLPRGWKPLSLVGVHDRHIRVLCRKWYRLEDKRGDE